MDHRQALQPPLFERHVLQQMLRVNAALPAIRQRYSAAYTRWLCSPVRERQRSEVLVRQRFFCWHCGFLLDPRKFDTHHNLGYENLGYEEASDLVAVHRRCHRILEDQKRAAQHTHACGCTRAA